MKTLILNTDNGEDVLGVSGDNIFVWASSPMSYNVLAFDSRAQACRAMDKLRAQNPSMYNCAIMTQPNYWCAILDQFVDSLSDL